MYSWLILQFTFSRRLSYHIIQIYTPTILLATISYCAFWLGNNVFPGRITLGITSQLALITQFSGVRARLPQVSYINVSIVFVSAIPWTSFLSFSVLQAVDVWMIVCMLFIFSTILVTTIVVSLDINLRRSNRQTSVEEYAIPWYRVFPETQMTSYKANSRFRMTSVHHQHQQQYQQQSMPSRRRSSNKLDSWCKVVYPILFAFFNIVYWSLLFTHI